MAPSISEQPIAAPVVAFGKKQQVVEARPRTSGQHEPLYNLLRRYSDFPTEITGPTVWKAEDYKNNPERWTHWWSEEEIAEIETAAKKFLDEGRDLISITTVCHPNLKVLKLDRRLIYSHRNSSLSPKNLSVSSNSSAKTSPSAKASSCSKASRSTAGVSPSPP